MTHKWVYLFTEGNATMRELLGGKGAGVAEMTRTGVPVPPGFTITTEACNAYYENGKQFPEGLWDQALVALKDIEAKTGKKFGDPSNPAARLRSLRRARFDAGHDGHRTQPGLERGNNRGISEADR